MSAFPNVVYDFPESINLLEMQVLHSLLTGDNPADCVSVLKPDFFESPAHRDIYSAVLYRFRHNEPIDNISIAEYLKDQGKLQQSGGNAYIMELSAGLFPGCTLMAPVGFYANRLSSVAKRRKVFELAHDLLALSEGEALNELLPSVRRKTEALLTSFTDGNLATVSLDSGLAHLTQKLNAANGLTGLSTGFNRLDGMLGGIQPSQFLCLGARPSNGKTALALNISWNIIQKYQRPVLFFSLETDNAQLAGRSLQYACSSQVSIEAAKEAYTKIKPFERLLQVVPPGNLTADDIVARIHQQKAIYPDLALVVVDHLALIASTGKNRFDNRTYELGETTRLLQMTARTLQVPILLLCQLNRNIEGRGDKKPLPSDFRDSGAIEQDADVLMASQLYRNEEGKLTGDAIVTVLKNREGETGETPMRFYQAATRFEEKHYGF